MSKLDWAQVGQRLYETGVDRGVLYIDSNAGVPWPGLTEVSEAASSSDVKQYYYDGFNYLNVQGSDDFKATITAFYSPREFDACDGTLSLTRGLNATQQRRKTFGFSYRTKIGNDLVGTDYAYKIHIVYNVLAAPSQHQYSSIGQDVTVSPLSWDVVTKPIKMVGAAPTAHFIIDTTELYPWAISAIEDILYGTDTDDPRLPTPTELLDLVNSNNAYEATLDSNGVFTLTVPEEALTMVSDTEWEILWDSPTYITPDNWVITAPEGSPTDDAGP